MWCEGGEDEGYVMTKRGCVDSHQVNLHICAACYLKLGSAFNAICVPHQHLAKIQCLYAEHVQDWKHKESKFVRPLYIANKGRIRLKLNNKGFPTLVLNKSHPQKMFVYS